MFLSKWVRVAFIGGTIAASCVLVYLYSHLGHPEEQRANDETSDEEISKKEEQECNEETELPPEHEKVEESDAVKIEDEATPTKLHVSTASKKQALEILESVVESQTAMKEIMKKLIQSFISRDNVTLKSAYEEVKSCLPEDPLEASGLSVEEFDQLLTRYQNDEDITKTVACIMGMGSMKSTAEEAAPDEECTVDTIVKVHQFMLQEILGLIQEVESSPEKDYYDPKTVTIVIQALVGANVEKKFKLTSAALENAVLRLHVLLEDNTEFAGTNLKIQKAIADLVERTSKTTF